LLAVTPYSFDTAARELLPLTIGARVVIGTKRAPAIAGSCLLVSSAGM
jgi:hypothetical protein